MLTKKEQETIRKCAIKYNVTSVFLFGSSLTRRTKANDIDLAVKGVEPGIFFKFYGELLKRLEKTVDLVDLSEESLFTELIKKKAVKIYG